MAENLWKLAILGVVLIVANGLLFDFGLFWLRQPTITSWLRENASYFWWPAGLMMGLLVLLGLHLFVEPTFLRLWRGE